MTYETHTLEDGMDIGETIREFEAWPGREPAEHDGVTVPERIPEPEQEPTLVPAGVAGMVR